MEEIRKSLTIYFTHGILSLTFLIHIYTINNRFVDCTIVTGGDYYFFDDMHFKGVSLISLAVFLDL